MIAKQIFNEEQNIVCEDNEHTLAKLLVSVIWGICERRKKMLLSALFRTFHTQSFLVRVSHFLQTYFRRTLRVRQGEGAMLSQLLEKWPRPFFSMHVDI